jgi:hypothetical protein
MFEDTLKITQNEDGSFTMDWDPKDPKWAFLNNLTSEQIQIIFKEAIDEKLNGL